MLKAGVPARAVELKMRAEGADEESITQVLASSDAAPAAPMPPQAAAAPPAALPEATAKFAKMLKAGVPARAVELKMRAEGHDELISLVMNGSASSKGGGVALPSRLRDASIEPDVSCLTEGEKALEAKFAAMIKAGVPSAAVIQKMTSEGISEAVMRAAVGDRGDDDNTARAERARAPPIMRRRSLGTGIALINLHWTPLPADALSSTIWQAAAAENAAPAEGDVLDDDTTTAQMRLTKLSRAMRRTTPTLEPDAHPCER